MNHAPMIMIVDDDTSVRATIGQALTALGYLVREAPDGPTALDLVSREELSLVILDYLMPGMGGAMKQMGDVDERELDRLEAIILSMTPYERAHPDRIDGSRRKRIAVSLRSEYGSIWMSDASCR